MEYVKFNPSPRLNKINASSNFWSTRFWTSQGFLFQLMAKGYSQTLRLKVGLVQGVAVIHGLHNFTATMLDPQELPAQISLFRGQRVGNIGVKTSSHPYNPPRFPLKLTLIKPKGFRV